MKSIRSSGVFRQLFLTSLALSICVAGSGSAQRRVESRQEPPKGFDHVRDKTDGWDWTRGEWTRNDDAFKKFRVSIEAQVDKAPVSGLAIKLRQMVATRLSTLKQKPKDQTAMFEWAVCAFALCSPRVDAKFRNEPWALDPTNRFSSFDQLANSYEFTRMRFLMKSMDFAYKELVPLGKKLLTKNPKDERVKMGLVAVCAARTKEEETLGKKYADELVAAHPQRANLWALVGSQYWMAWRKDNSEQDRQRAMFAYEKYLKLAPSEDQFRQSARQILSELKQRRR